MSIYHSPYRSGSCSCACAHSHDGEEEEGITDNFPPRRFRLEPLHPELPDDPYDLHEELSWSPCQADDELIPIGHRIARQRTLYASNNGSSRLPNQRQIAQSQFTIISQGCIAHRSNSSSSIHHGIYSIRSLHCRFCFSYLGLMLIIQSIHYELASLPPAFPMVTS
jgi:hypothetical protein